MMADLLDDIEKGGEWPAFMLEITTSMIPKEMEPDSTHFEEREVMTGSAMAIASDKQWLVIGKIWRSVSRTSENGFRNSQKTRWNQAQHLLAE